MQAMRIKTTSAFGIAMPQKALINVPSGVKTSTKGKQTKGAAFTLNKMTRTILNAAVLDAPVAPSAPSTQTETPMDIVFISTEVAPWSKTGKRICQNLCIMQTNCA